MSRIRALVIVLLVSTFLVEINSKGGRGGGFRMGGGSRFGSRNPAPARNNYGGNNYGRNNYGGNSYGGGYRSGSGMRWSSFGTGMVAYAAMSSLIRSSHGHGYYGGTYNGYGQYSNYRPNGQFCVNNEDFNGTKFGRFQCPLPGFNRRDTYCCGEDEYQFCCGYWDDSGRKGWTLFGIFAALAAFIGTGYFIMTKVREREMKEDFDDPIEMPPYNQNYGPGQMGPRPMGPGYGPRPMGPGYGPRPMGPGYGPRPMGPGYGPRPMGPGPVAPRPQGPPPDIGFKQPLLPNS